MNELKFIFLGKGYVLFFGISKKHLNLWCVLLTAIIHLKQFSSAWKVLASDKYYRSD